MSANNEQKLRFMKDHPAQKIVAVDGRCIEVGDLIEGVTRGRGSYSTATVRGEVLGFGQWPGEVYLRLATEWVIYGPQWDPASAGGKRLAPGDVCCISFDLGCEQQAPGVYSTHKRLHRDDPFSQDVVTARFEIVSRPADQRESEPNTYRQRG